MLNQIKRESALKLFVKNIDSINEFLKDKEKNHFKIAKSLINKNLAIYPEEFYQLGKKEKEEYHFLINFNFLSWIDLFQSQAFKYFLKREGFNNIIFDFLSQNVKIIEEKNEMRDDLGEKYDKYKLYLSEENLKEIKLGDFVFEKMEEYFSNFILGNFEFNYKSYDNEFFFSKFKQNLADEVLKKYLLVNYDKLYFHNEYEHDEFDVIKEIISVFEKNITFFDNHFNKIEFSIIQNAK